MNIIGCDLHTRYQVVAWVDEETGEILTLRLEHENGEARAFYAGWAPGLPARGGEFERGILVVKTA